MLFKEPIILILVYSIFCSFILDPANIGNILQLTSSLLFVYSLFRLNIKYIDFIIKSIIILCFIFSLSGIIQFLFLQFEPKLINQLDMRFISSTRYIDLSDSTLFSYLGFASIGEYRTFLGIDFMRLRSFASEPSVMVPIFYVVGIMSFLYSMKFKIMGIIILFFSIFIVFAGTMHLALLFSLIFYVYTKLINPDPKRGSLFIMVAIIILIVLINLLGNTFFLIFVKSSKAGSLLARLGDIILYTQSIIMHPLINMQLLELSGGFLFKNALVVPIIGISITIKLFIKLFISNFKIFKKYTIFSTLIMGVLIESIFFTSYGWETLPGFVILTLIYIKTIYLSDITIKNKNYEKNTIYYN